MKAATNLARLVLTLAVLTLASIPLTARVLDNFDDNTKTQWQDFLFPVGPYAQITESGGQFHFNLVPVGQPIFASSTKTSETFDLKEGRTIEFRTDLVSGNGNDSFAILAFIPTSQSVQSLNGYGFAKSTSDILITKSLDKYFYNENPPTAIKNENVTLVLSLTVRNGNVIINSKVLDKDANNAVLFERTFVDTPAADVLSDGTDNGPAYMGAGNFVLMCYEDDGTTQESYEVTLDNAEVFVTDTTVLDDFNDNSKTEWQDFLFPVGPYAQITEGNGQFHFNLVPVGQPIFAASSKTSRTFDLVDGERVEFRVDMVGGNGNDSFAVLAFVPTTEPVASLNGYGFSKSASDILVTKSLDKYFYNENPPTAIKNENVTMVLSLTARGQTVTINAKLLDKDANNAVLFERTFVDTPAADVLSDGTDNGPAYMGSGRFVLMCYEDDGTTQTSYEVTFDNAEASAAPLPSNTPPGISNISIEPSANFLPSNTPLSFTVTDNADLADSGISLTLNGEKLTSTNGLVLTGTPQNRTVTFSNLLPNNTYMAVIDVTDAEQATNRSTFTFDTFSTNSFVIEIEDYNFGGGSSIDNPVPIAEGTGPQATGYANQVGIKAIDYSDTRNDFSSVPYRPEDNVRMQRTLDYARAKYIAAGGAGAGVYDYDVSDIEAGEWLNYTRTIPSGTYEIYLREALRNGTQIETALEAVLGGATSETQSTRPLGSFITTSTGFQFRNVPLTDAVGNKRSVMFTGDTTLRLRQVSGDPDDGAIYQTYLILIPTTNLASHPSIASLSPAPGSTTNTVTPRIEATFLNSVSSVRTDSIKLYVDGAPVNPTVTSTVEGATLSYDITPLPPSGTTITSRIEFTDTDDLTQTNSWSFTITYNSLDANNRAIGDPNNRGFHVRVVQSPQEAGALENSLLRAEEQLAANSTIPKYLDTNVVLQVINMNQFEGDAGQIPGDTVVPGLELGENGTEDFSVEIRGYLDLTAGIHRFYVNTDDGFKLTFGTSTNDQTTLPIAFRSGGPSEQTFDVVVPEQGLYPMRLVWYERGGGASAEFASVDRTNGTRTLINDPDSPATAIRAYTLVSSPDQVVESSAVVDSGYTVEPAA
ncbi:MAG TPA: hypothetical protein VFG14_08250, partial [Chthoniobacteraceae bacterium]|nr:hypothetical protein [Chthoniobacteraceae bacterium]